LKRKPKPTIQAAKIAALERPAQPGPREFLIECLHAPTPVLWLHAAENLIKFADLAAVEPLIRCINDPDERVGSAAYVAILATGAPAVEPILLHLNDPDETVRAALARLLDAMEIRKRSWHSSNWERAIRFVGSIRTSTARIHGLIILTAWA